MYNRDTIGGADPFYEVVGNRNRGDIVQEETVQEESKEKALKKQESVAKYTIKDSVFTSLFQDKKYLIQLYRAADIP